MIFTTWSVEELLSFFMVLVRISTMIMLLPIFGDKVIPANVKIVLSLTFAAVLFPILKANGVIHLEDAHEWAKTTGSLLTTLGIEVLVGLGIGFVSQLVFQAIQIGGDFMAQFMGLSMASVYDPHMEGHTMVLGQMLSALAMLTFLSVDGHHILFRAMVETFNFIPQGHLVIGPAFRDSMSTLVGSTILIGIQLSAPMAMCMMLVNIVYGIMGKALPQLNILTLSMASSVFIGSMVLLITYPSVQNGMSNLFQGYFEDLKDFMVVYGGK